MVKGAYILMAERESQIRLITTTQVVNGASFETIRVENPFIAKLMLDTFKDFLNDTYFTALERQTFLLQFFKTHTDLEVIREVLTCISESPNKEDYTRIVMEWTLRASESIVEANLTRYDGANLCLDKKPNKLGTGSFTIEDGVDYFMDALLQVNDPEIFGDDDLGGYV